MASRFWAAGSSSEEESENSSGSDVEISQQQQARAASRWAVQSDSDSDEEVRVVKSAKDKAFDNIETCCQHIRNHLKINDWTKVVTEFDTMCKHLEKAKNVLQTQGYPAFYMSAMMFLEDEMNEKIKNKAEQKKMSKDNSKALIRMKGKLKKHLEPMQAEMDRFRANPVDSSEEEDESSSEESSEEASSEESDSEEDSEEDSDDSDKPLKKKKVESDESEEDESEEEDEEDSDDDDSWPSESESSSESDSDDDGELKGRAKWLKQTPATTTKRKEKGPKAPKAARAEKVRRSSMELKKVEEELKLSASQFDRRVKEIVAQRGKKGIELNEQIATLRKLANYARRLGPAREVVATMYILGAQMYDASNKIDRVMSASAWKSARSDLASILTLLEQNPGFSLNPLSSEDQADIMQVGREGTNAAEAEEADVAFVDTLPKAGEKGAIKVSGDLAAFVERLSEEYTKSLQQTDPHTSEYIARLFDEGLLMEVAHRVQKYYERQGDNLRASVVALIRAELIYYKHESIAKALHESQAKRKVYGDPSMLHPACNSTSAKRIAVTSYNPSMMHPGALSGQPTVKVKAIDSEKELKDVCMFVFKYADNRAKTRAMLCRIYHHAIHDRFHDARDLLLMSHIQDNITDADIPTQILFNRMMAQLGLCAFRSGLIWEAHACLSEICTGSRTKELLAQGMQSYRFQERDPEQERLERRRQVPYHMHINLDLLETCHLVSAMLLEVPNMVNTRASDRKRLVSKSFRKLLEFHERLVFEGPPENPRDHVVAAAKFLAQGSWRKSAELLVGLSVWDLLPGVDTTERVKKMVQHKIQVEALRTYLLAFSEEYDSVSLARLTEMFELDDKTVHSFVSKMMINEELQGAWDQSSQSIVLHKNGRSTLHTLALQYSDKLATIVENNERMMDLRSGSSKDEWNTNRREGGNRMGGSGSNRGGVGESGRRFGDLGRSSGGRGRGYGNGGRGSFRPGGGRRGGGRSGGQQRQ